MADSMAIMVKMLQQLKKIQQNLVDLKDAIEAESLVEEVQPEVEHESKQEMVLAFSDPGTRVESRVTSIGTLNRQTKVSANTPPVYHHHILHLKPVEYGESCAVKRFSDFEIDGHMVSCTPTVCINVSMSGMYDFVDAKMLKPPWKPPDLNLICVPRNEDFVSYYLKFEWFNEFANTMDSRGYLDFTAYVQVVELKDEVLEKGFRVDSKVFGFSRDGHVKNENEDGVFAVYEEQPPVKKSTGNIRSLNIMVEGCRVLGKLTEVVKGFERMGVKGCSPDTLSTFDVSLLTIKHDIFEVRAYAGGFSLVVRIHWSPTHELFLGIGDRIIMVSGNFEEVLNAKYLIFRKLLNEMEKEGGHEAEPNSRVKMIVPNGACGGLIGKGESNIKSLIEASRAGMKISPLDANYYKLNDRLVMITGSLDDQMEAIKLILHKLFEDPQYPHFVTVQFSYAAAYSTNFGPNGNKGQFPNNKDDQSNATVTMGISDDHMGLVFGRGGRNITEISRVSGARIKILDRGDFIIGIEERKVTITGLQRDFSKHFSVIATCSMGISSSVREAYNVLKRHISLPCLAIMSGAFIIVSMAVAPASVAKCLIENTLHMKEVLELWQGANPVCFDVNITECVNLLDELAEFCGLHNLVHISTPSSFSYTCEKTGDSLTHKMKEKPVEGSTPEYEKLKHSMFELENHLTEAQHHAYCLMKRNKELGNSRSDLGKTVKMLGTSDGNALGKAFSKIRGNSEMISFKLQEEAHHQLMNFVEPLKDYVRVVQFIKETVVERGIAFKQQCEMAESIKLKEINMDELLLMLSGWVGKAEIEYKELKVKSDGGFVIRVLEHEEIDLAHMLSKKWKDAIYDNWLEFYWQQILLAVNAIHEELTVQSDLKPANFLLVKDSLKLIYFGIEKVIMSYLATKGLFEFKIVDEGVIDAACKNKISGNERGAVAISVRPPTLKGLSDGFSNDDSCKLKVHVFQVVPCYEKVYYNTLQVFFGGYKVSMKDVKAIITFSPSEESPGIELLLQASCRVKSAILTLEFDKGAPFTFFPSAMYEGVAPEFDKLVEEQSSYRQMQGRLVFLVSCIGTFLLFSLPRPPEDEDLEDKVHFKGGGMLCIGIYIKLRGLFVIDVISLV